MDKKMNEFHISANDLTDETILMLLSLYDETFSIIHHDMNSKFVVLTGTHQIFTLVLDSIKKIGEQNSLDLENEISELEALILSSEKSVYTFREEFFNHFERKTEVENRYDRYLLAKPYKVFEKIKSVYSDEGINIFIGKRSPKTLEIAFPKSILYAMMSELVNNARKACSHGCKIQISWRMNKNRFECQVDDNGRGVIPDNYNGVATLDLVKTFLQDKTAHFEGLSMCNRILFAIGGILFFSKSTVLGGTQVSFTFPVFAFYKKGK